MRFLALRQLLKTKGEAQISCILQQFRCSRNPELQEFIHSKAINYENNDRTRTFVLIQNGKFEAFFSLALNVLDTTNIASNTTKKKLSPINSPKDNFIACFLIGQLGKDDTSKIEGKDILNEALSYLLVNHTLLGSKFILVDSTNKKGVVDFYKNNGFKSIIADEDGQTIKMVMFFKDKQQNKISSNSTKPTNPKKP